MTLDSTRVPPDRAGLIEMRDESLETLGATVSGYAERGDVSLIGTAALTLRKLCHETRTPDADSFRCNRCRVSQPVEGRWDGTTEPVWYYRLAEVVYQLPGANGDVPLLAVADAFSESRSPLQSYELAVFPP